MWWLLVVVVSCVSCGSGGVEDFTFAKIAGCFILWKVAMLGWHRAASLAKQSMVSRLRRSVRGGLLSLQCVGGGWWWVVLLVVVVWLLVVVGKCRPAPLGWGCWVLCGWCRSAVKPGVVGTSWELIALARGGRWCVG